MLDTDASDGGDIHVYVHLGTRHSTPKKIGGQQGLA